MSSQVLIREELLRIAHKWPQVRLRFQFDPLCLTHAIEVQPAYLHEIDLDFRLTELQVMDKVTAIFPEQGVYFILPGDSGGIEGEADGTIHGFWANMATEEPEFIWPSGTHVVIDPMAGYGKDWFQFLLPKPNPDPTASMFPIPPAETWEHIGIEKVLPNGTDHLERDCPDGTDYAIAA
jgi:hypothetical protein